MARFIRSTKMLDESPPAPNETASNAPDGWNTLEELRQIVMSKGCTKAQFDFAVETVGEDPHRVANYVQRYAFTQETSDAN